MNFKFNIPELDGIIEAVYESLEMNRQILENQRVGLENQKILQENLKSVANALGGSGVRPELKELQSVETPERKPKPKSKPKALKPKSASAEVSCSEPQHDHDHDHDHDEEQCIVPDCSEPFYSKGLCIRHYQSHRLAQKKSPESEQRWLKKYKVTSEDIEKGKARRKRGSRKSAVKTPAKNEAKSADTGGQEKGEGNYPKARRETSEAAVSPSADICLINDCGRKAHSRGLCSAHYQQYREATKKGGESEFFDEHDIEVLPRGKKGRRTKEDVDPTPNVDMSRVLEDKKSYKEVKELKLTSVSISEITKELDSSLDRKFPELEYWVWRDSLNGVRSDGRVLLDLEKNSLLFFSKKDMAWEGQVWERELIVSLADKFQVRYIRIDDDLKVLTSNFRNYYALPEESDGRFLLRAKLRMDRPDVFWEVGDLFYIHSFRIDGSVIDAVYAWLVKPPCFDAPSEDDPLWEEWNNATKNICAFAGADKIEKWFELLFNGVIPVGAHDKLREISSSQIESALEKD